MANERHKAVPAVYLILKKANHILLIRRKNTGYFDGWYTCPSGHVEEGELPLEALARESLEEVGISIDTNKAKLVHTMYRTKHDPTGDRADYFFELNEWQGEIINAEPTKCDDLQWFDLDALPKNLIPHERLAIENFKKDITYSQLGIDDVVLNPNK